MLDEKSEARKKKLVAGPPSKHILNIETSAYWHIRFSCIETVSPGTMKKCSNLKA